MRSTPASGLRGVHVRRRRRRAAAASQSTTWNVGVRGRLERRLRVTRCRRFGALALPARPQARHRDRSRGLHRGARDVHGGGRIPVLMRERRFSMRPGVGPGRTFLLGAAFAFAWTPCIGPTLGAALNLAATSTGLRSGIALLFAYSLG